ncbi:MAG: histidine phosphatase family protein [Usitatibacter sp.]
MTRFIVVRHGETRLNVATRIQGHGDSPLTQLGIAQAEAIAERMAGEKFDVLVSSDLGRAVDTARRIASRCAVPLATDARLRERCFGVGEGLTYDEIDTRYPDAFSRTSASDPDYVIPGGESRRAFHERVTAAFADLARTHEGRRVAVVSHGGVLSSVYRLIHAIPIAAAHRIKITNASFNAFASHGGAWTLEAWDDVAHLPGANPLVDD